VSALQKFLRLPPAERRLLIQAALLLGGIRVGLRLLPYRVVRNVVAQRPRAPISIRRGGGFSVDQITWAVTKISRYVPKSTCLAQALAAQVLLTRHDHPAHLHVGITRGKDGGLRGHAWLESRGRTVVGGEELSRYTRVPGMEIESP
jgi:Transglutaminase-like superfamily